MSVAASARQIQNRAVPSCMVASIRATGKVKKATDHFLPLPPSLPAADADAATVCSLAQQWVGGNWSSLSLSLCIDTVS